MTVGKVSENIEVWIITVLVIVMIVGAIIALVKLIPLIRKFAAFLSDVAGEDARAGRDRVPGLFERLSNIEAVQNQVLSKVEKVHHEVFPNSGKSLRDQTNRIEAKVSKDYQEISRLKGIVEALETSVEGQRTELVEHIEVSTGILNTLKKEQS